MERISVSEWGRFLLDLEEYQQRIIIGCALRGVEATTKSLKKHFPAAPPLLLLVVLLLPLVDARSERATRRAFCRNIFSLSCEVFRSLF
jgi:hypothetical protein